MPPVIDEFWASMAAQWHLVADHHVAIEEAVEAAESSQRHYRTHSGGSTERRYVVPGKTADGRRLWVVFADEGHRRGRIITALDPAGQQDRVRHRRMRGD
jgi:uncharacterized DUF497 family protein